MEEVIEKAKERISECETKLEDAKRDLVVILHGQRCMKEMVFEQKYRVSAEDVRTEYYKRVLALSGSCGEGHYTKIIDMDLRPSEHGYKQDFIKPDSSHIGLLPKNYEEALQTEKEFEAYAIIRKEIWIDPETHIEYWGN